GRGGRVGERVRVVLGAAPREKECGTEHQGGEPHAGPTPVCTPPCGTATFSSVTTTSSGSSKSLLLSAAVSWPGSQAMRSSSASRPCGSPGNSFRMSCAVRPSASGKSRQSRSTSGSTGSSGAGSWVSDGSGSSLVGGVVGGGVLVGGVVVGGVLVGGVDSVHDTVLRPPTFDTTTEPLSV